MGLDDLLSEKQQLEIDDFELQEAYPTKLPVHLQKEVFFAI
jgi:hypothetical protein